MNLKYLSSHGGGSIKPIDILGNHKSVSLLCTEIVHETSDGVMYLICLLFLHDLFEKMLFSPEVKGMCFEDAAHCALLVSHLFPTDFYGVYIALICGHPRFSRDACSD